MATGTAQVNTTKWVPLGTYLIVYGTVPKAVRGRVSLSANLSLPSGKQGYMLRIAGACSRVSAETIAVEKKEGVLFSF